MATLIVRSHPWLPEPGAARVVVETALEPLVAVDVDTRERSKQADETNSRTEQTAAQYRQMPGGRRPEQPSGPGVFQE